jgi:hypothetical protein
MVTRRMSLADYGLWLTISDYIAYFVLPSRVISYWVTRYVARGFNVSKTGVLLNLELSIICFLVSLLLAPYLVVGIEASVIYFFLGGFLIPLSSTVAGLEAVANATKPEVQSYGFIASELSKVGIGALFVAFLRLGVFGIIATIFFAKLLQIVSLFFFLRDKIGGGFNRSMVRRWFSLSWIPIYGSVAALLISLDTFIFLILTGSTLPKAYMGAPAVISNIVAYSSLLAYALYPKLLKGGDKKDIEVALKLVLLFATPMTFGSLILAAPLMYILGMEYAVTENVLRVLVIGAFLGSVSGIFDGILSGTERVELMEGATLRDYLKSKIFLLPTLTYVQAALYVPTVFLLTYYSVLNGIPYLTLIFWCVLVNLIVSIPLIFYKWIIARRMVRFDFPWSSLARYLIAATVMAAFVLIFYPSGAYSEKLEYVLSGLLPVIAIGAVIYLSLVHAIDREAKSLINSAFAYLKQILRSRGNVT